MKYTVELVQTQGSRPEAIIAIDSMSTIPEMNSLVLLILALLHEGKRVVIEG